MCGCSNIRSVYVGIIFFGSFMVRQLCFLHYCHQYNFINYPVFVRNATSFEDLVII
jgi:hypothetical protein